MIKRILLLFALLGALGLAACGGGGGGSAPPPVRQFGVAESQLYDPTLNPNGIIVGPGSGLVSLQLEPVGGAPAPLVGDTATVGVDTLWFTVDQAGTFSIDLSPADLQTLSRVAILSASGASLLVADAANPSASVALPTGQYELRVDAAAGATAVRLVLAWFGGSPSATVATATDRLKQTASCVGCDLRRADLAAANLRAVNLSQANLSDALLARVPGGLTLASGQVFELLLDGGQVQGADLSGANLAGAILDSAFLTGAGGSAANLSGANLTGASVQTVFLQGATLDGAQATSAKFDGSDLSGANLAAANLSGASLVGTLLVGANLSGANLASANLTNAHLQGANFSGANVAAIVLAGADLSGATWTDGSKVCAAGSIGQCN